MPEHVARPRLNSPLTTDQHTELERAMFKGELSPEMKELFDIVVKDGTRKCACGHVKSYHSDDVGVQTYCALYGCHCQSYRAAPI
ncbi:hypothetical protein SEA_POKYPUPPY_80 [Gordonia phage PokyPuppy]|nr:hypothetical protein SEA_POKYPUPPY_80 [Gordonia phage PokyPuppy]